MGPTWGPPGSCRPQMGLMLVPWILLSWCLLLCCALCTVADFPLGTIWLFYIYREVLTCQVSKHQASPHLTHWGQVTHICVSKITIIGSDNGLLPGWCPAIIWTNAGTLLIGTLGTNLNQILSDIHIFSFREMYLKMSYGKWKPFCLDFNMWIKYDALPVYKIPLQWKRQSSVVEYISYASLRIIHVNIFSTST